MDNGVFNTEDEKSRQPSVISNAPSIDAGKSDPTRGSNSTRALTNGRQDSLQFNSSGMAISEIDLVREELIKRKIIDQLKKKGYKNVEEDLASHTHNYGTAAYYLLRSAYLSNKAF